MPKVIKIVLFADDMNLCWIQWKSDFSIKKWFDDKQSS